MVACQLLPTLSQHQINVARAVLVNQSTYQAAADRYGGTRQAAHKTTTAVWVAYERFKAAERAAEARAYADLPEGWERVTLDAPSELIEQIRKQLETYQENTPKPSPGRRKKTRPADGEPG